MSIPTITKGAKQLRRMAKGHAKRKSFTLKELESSSEILDLAYQAGPEAKKRLYNSTGMESALDVIKRKRMLKKKG